MTSGISHNTMFSTALNFIKNIFGYGPKTVEPRFFNREHEGFTVQVLGDTHFNATKLCWHYGKSFSGWYNKKKIQQLKKNNAVLPEIYVRTGENKGIYVDMQLLVFLKEWINKIAGKGSQEKIVQEKLALELNGQMEVEVKLGRIDILTADEIIEVKTYDDWKGAVGQIIVYGYFFPKHRKRIHLFGVDPYTQDKYQLPDIKKILSTQNITLTVENIIFSKTENTKCF
jgi:hypothetical protein